MELSFYLWEPKPGAASANLVLLHGMGGTGALWRPIAASLENRYRIMAPDQRGHGKSRERQSSFLPLDFGRDLVETLDHTGFHPAWLIGHSMGVRTACAAALLRPEWVRGLILIDLGFSGAAGGGLGDRLAAFLEKLPSTFASRADARAFMRAQAPDPSMGQYLMAVAQTAPDGRVTFPFDPQALIQTIEAARESSVRPWIRQVAERGMPVLALRGSLSEVWSKADFEAEKERFSDLKSVTFEEVAGTGHGLPFDKRAEFVSRVADFVDRKP
ncbi:MAG: alpha/beta hydrolase [Oligoflexia bacterium]|nr:alpha/beta hydrolase [Oligoflexia bacterium]